MFKISKGYSNVTKTIRISIPMDDKLEKLAAENNISFNQLINQCISFALEHREEENSEKRHKTMKLKLKNSTLK